MKLERATVDFETKKIESRPLYPPRPVGVAIKYPDGSKVYRAWGHPTGNNCDISEARRELKDVYDNHRVIFHNSIFDMDVSEVHMALRPPAQFDDTLYLSFLNDPFEPTLSLKPMSEKHLGMPPEEQNRLKDWILANVKEAKGKKKEWKEWGAYISEAPVSLAGPYAKGDVDRTEKLYRKFRPIIHKRGMSEAYRRELKLTPITLEMERGGMRVHQKKLKEALGIFEKMDATIMHRVRKKLGVGLDFNVNSNPQLSEALVRAGKLDTIIKTEGGAVSTKIDVLKKTCNDKYLLKLLSVHSVCEKYITSFLRPWIEQAEITHGRILPRFNQVRNRTDEGYGGGARSGRYSSSDPNMQNISSNVEDSQNREVLELMQKWLLELHSYQFIGLRDFILPDEDTVLISVDYNQQELRILAHFEQDVLMRAYLENPKLDIHEYCRQLVYKATGILYERKHIKITVFGIVYGMGIDKLAARLESDRDTANAVREGIYQAVPGIKRMQKGFKKLANRNRPLVTWGGREYFCEEPKFDKRFKRWMSYEYKMLNYKIQPSAADVTKQGMINVHEALPDVRIAIQVHDELVCMAKNRSYGPRIAEAMCDMEFNVPMLADAKYSTKSWARAA